MTPAVRPLRSILAILAAVMLLNFMDATLQNVLVAAAADRPPTDEASYLLVRNRPAILAGTLISHVFAAMLVGYLLARMAGAHEVTHALVAAGVLTLVYGYAFTLDNAMLPPAWVRIALLLVTPPALIAGAKVRADARAARESDLPGGAGPPEGERTGPPEGGSHIRPEGPS